MSHSKKNVDVNISSAKFLLNSAHPEIFNSTPRSGGFIRVLIPPRSRQNIIAFENQEDDIGDNTSTFSQSSSFLPKKKSSLRPADKPLHLVSSREFRLKKAIENSGWELTKEKDETPLIGVSDPHYDNLKMLSITISTVMLMAAEVPNIADEYFVWTEKYLSCIRDENGTMPPNVHGIVNHINYLKNGGVEEKNMKTSSKASSSKNLNDGFTDKDDNRKSDSRKKGKHRNNISDTSTGSNTSTSIPVKTKGKKKF